MTTVRPGQLWIWGYDRHAGATYRIDMVLRVYGRGRATWRVMYASRPIAWMTYDGVSE